MTYKPLTKNLAQLLRDAGLKVVEIDGWQTRGRGPEHGEFDPVGVLWHHTGSYDSLTDAQDDVSYAKWLAVTGRPGDGLPAPLCHLSISAEGTVFVIAAGRANHAGKAKASGSVAAGDGNRLYVGVECMNSGKQGWPKSQYDAMVKVGVVLGTKVVGCTERAQRGHLETSITGKWDPGMLNMDKFRGDITKASLATPVKKPVVVKAKSRGKNVDDAIASIELALAYARTNKLAARVERLENGLCWLKQIEEM